jgi:1,4-alpha-glucan branching enzyme
MAGYLSLVLHAHLPFVRHPEHEYFLEESWLYEAITETYLPLLRVLEGWERDGIAARLTLTLSPPLCSMLLDPLLMARYDRHLNALIDLAEKETHRTHLDKQLNPLAEMYLRQFREMRELWIGRERNLVRAFGALQDAGRIEIITCAATHALLPLLAAQPESIRAQILTGRDHYRSCFGRDPRGIWLPECAYVPQLDAALGEAGIRWFITETHGVLHAQPRPQYGIFAPILTTNGIAVFGRDLDSARQVWSRQEGYPGDPRYRDFYKDVAFELDYEYLKPYFPAPQRTFTGIKYHRIGGAGEKAVYDPRAASEAARDHAAHFVAARAAHAREAEKIMERPPVLMAPYDAELFGHWWHEGPQFLDHVGRLGAAEADLQIATPEMFLAENPAHQVAQPAASSWGEEGYWKVWLNDTNRWIFPHLNIAGERMAELARKFKDTTIDALTERALQQAGRELQLAQSSDWPFILRTNTSPEYARRRVKDHLLRFISLHEQLTSTQVDEERLSAIEKVDNIFPQLDFRYWA